MPPGFHGGGVARSATQPDTKFESVMQFAGVGGEKPEPAKHFDGPWGPKPAVARQMFEFPNTWRYSGAEQYKTFTLPEQEAQLNEFLKPTFPMDAPARKIIERSSRNAGAGILLVLRFVDIEYMQLPQPSPAPAPTPAPALPPKGRLP